jgi:transposase
VARCQTRPIAHVAAEMGISRQCASKWGNRYRRHGEAGLADRPSVPHHQPTATPAEAVTRIEQLRRDRKYSAPRIATELAADGSTISARTVGRHLLHLGLNRRRFIDPTGHSNREPRPIIAHWPAHMAHLDVNQSPVRRASRVGGGGLLGPGRRQPGPRLPRLGPRSGVHQG